MLKRFNDFDVTPSFAKPPVLPKGGYVVKVKDVATKVTNYKQSSVN